MKTEDNTCGRRRSLTSPFNMRYAASTCCWTCGGNDSVGGIFFGCSTCALSETAQPSTPNKTITATSLSFPTMDPSHNAISNGHPMPFGHPWSMGLPRGELSTENRNPQCHYVDCWTSKV